MWILNLVAGLGFFLYGMKIMGEGLEKIAGDRMSRIIDKLTGSLIKGVMVGTVVTALIQSSSATTVMVVGFINAGIMSLQQAVGVIMGANIGTTVTSVLISLQDINSSFWIINIFKPTYLAPIAIGIGVILIQFVNKKHSSNIGEILAGFGFLFVGMDMMSSAMEFLSGYSFFNELMIKLSNPILGVLLGMVLTAVLQSSSASVGILQAAAATGLLQLHSAAAIILGQNIGTCITAMISAVGASRAAKKAAVVHLLFNIIGSLIFLIVLYALAAGRFIPGWTGAATSANIAGFHICFNVVNTLLLLPFNRVLVLIANRLLPEYEADRSEEPVMLETRLLSTPALAIAQAKRELVNMMKAASASVSCGYEMLNGKSVRTKEEVEDIENDIDLYESNITQYLVRIGDESLNEDENTEVSTMFHVITDIERIGDHAYNISNSVLEMKEKGIQFSEVASHKLNKMYEAVNRLVDMTLSAYDRHDVAEALSVQPLEDVIDYLKDHLKNEHLERLAKHECTFNTGVVYLDIVNNLERIADHCSNIGLTVEQLESDRSIDFDPHAHLKHMHDNKSAAYTKVYDKYIDRYTK
jgi:phosphate:Na+ symporter